jgi:hypothetical protein
MILPKLYPIIDLGCFASAADPIVAAVSFGEELFPAARPEGAGPPSRCTCRYNNVDIMNTI